MGSHLLPEDPLVREVHRQVGDRLAGMGVPHAAEAHQVAAGLLPGVRGVPRVGAGGGAGEVWVVGEGAGGEDVGEPVGEKGGEKGGEQGEEGGPPMATEGPDVHRGENKEGRVFPQQGDDQGVHQGVSIPTEHQYSTEVLLALRGCVTADSSRAQEMMLAVPVQLKKENR